MSAQRSNKVLTRDEVMEIYANGRSSTELASWYGVDPSTIAKIRSGRTWRWLTKHGELDAHR